ncbi:hypothetical protein QJS66_13525 [Kocuria rhizophila]|nr:hypothetical protein QJS66_13525 [Kocuria rhizophila]
MSTILPAARGPRGVALPEHRRRAPLVPRPCARRVPRAPGRGGRVHRRDRRRRVEPWARPRCWPPARSHPQGDRLNDTSSSWSAWAPPRASALALGGQNIDYGVVVALLIGGVAAAPLAAWLVRLLAPRPSPSRGPAGRRDQARRTLLGVDTVRNALPDAASRRDPRGSRRPVRAVRWCG